MVYCPDKYITQRMCSEVVDDSLAALKLIPNWFVTDKMIKKLYTAFYADTVYPFFMKVLVMSHFVVMKWAFLVKLLKMLILIIILMEMILILEY